MYRPPRTSFKRHLQNFGKDRRGTIQSSVLFVIGSSGYLASTSPIGGESGSAQRRNRSSKAVYATARCRLFFRTPSRDFLTNKDSSSGCVRLKDSPIRNWRISSTFRSEQYVLGCLRRAKLCGRFGTQTDEARRLRMNCGETA